MGHRIFIATSSFAEVDTRPLQIIENSGYVMSVNQTGRRLESQELVQAAQGCTAVIAGLEKYDASVFSRLPELRCISRCGVGVDNIDLKVAREKNVKIFNTPHAVIQPVAELTIALIFDLLRLVTRHCEGMHQGRWERFMGQQLQGKTVGILGLGRIGRRVAELLIRLEAKVIGCDIVPDQDWARQVSVKVATLEEVLSQADIVSVHLSKTTSEDFCLTEAYLTLMKKGAYLVNTARGSFVEESALEAMLKNGHLAGAALDVYQKEPYLGPLSGLPNVILTPHIATLTAQSRVEMEIQAVDQAIEFLKTI